jgi:DNA-binding transcriptional MerR regulator
MNIAELERRTGVSRHTLRYYEKEGLLLEVARRGNNYRDYSEQSVQRVTMMRQLKELGFSLREISDILDALRRNNIDCEQGARLMADKRAAVLDRIRQLQQLNELLAIEQARLEESARQRGKQ